mmetsp:Transcript_6929/g.17326  ORF Transcript_6929/g.17326 Transcript_6929/m.17326 type:complete len:201 (+) Transcript_6929:645-1247(+)
MHGRQRRTARAVQRRRADDGCRGEQEASGAERAQIDRGVPLRRAPERRQVEGERAAGAERHRVAGRTARARGGMQALAADDEDARDAQHDGTNRAARQALAQADAEQRGPHRVERDEDHCSCWGCEEHREREAGYRDGLERPQGEHSMRRQRFKRAAEAVASVPKGAVQQREAPDCDALPEEHSRRRGMRGHLNEEERIR